MDEPCGIPCEKAKTKLNESKVYAHLNVVQYYLKLHNDRNKASHTNQNQPPLERGKIQNPKVKCSPPPPLQFEHTTFISM
jgi:hypothetical protein